MTQIQRERSGFEFEVEPRGEHSVRIREAGGVRFLDATMQPGGRIVTNTSGKFTDEMYKAAKGKAFAILHSWQERSAAVSEQKEEAVF